MVEPPPEEVPGLMVPPDLLATPHRRMWDYLTQPLGMRSSVPSMITLKLLGIIIGIVSSIVIARALGPSGKGVYNFVLLTSMLLATFFNFGLKDGNFFYIAKKQMSVAAGYTATLALVALATVLLAIAIVLWRSLLHTWFPSIPEVWVAVGFLVFTPLSIHAYMTQSLLLGTNRAVALYALPLLVQVLTVGPVLVLLAVAGVGLAAVIWISVGALLVSQIAALAILHRGRTRLLEIPRMSASARAVRFGFPLWIATLLSVVLQRLDQLMIVHRLGAAELGQYALAVAVGEILWSIDIPITTAMRYRVAAGTGDEAAELVGRLTRMVVVVMTGVCLLMAVSARWIIPFLYSDRFLPAVPALIAYLPAVFFLSVARVVGEDIAFQRQRRDLVVITNTTALICNVVLLIVLIPPFGIVGASLASTGAYFIVFVMNAIFHTRLAGTRLRDTLVPRRSDVLELRALTKGYLMSVKGRLGKNGTGRSSR